MAIIITTVGTTVAIITGIEIFNVSYAQAQALTPQQRAAFCKPNDTFVNSTESKICGIPETLKNTTNATSTTANRIPSSIIPAP